MTTDCRRCADGAMGQLQALMKREVRYWKCWRWQWRGEEGNKGTKQRGFLANKHYRRGGSIRTLSRACGSMLRFTEGGRRLDRRKRH
ncbi:unnamed protein product, partial [Ectocarpus fasciculatus]